MRKIVIYAALYVMLLSCSTIFQSHTRLNIYDNNILHQTISWTHATENDIAHEFNDFVKESLTKTRNTDFILLFQSNYRLEDNERTYVIKLFRDLQEKKDYLNNSNDIIRRSVALHSKDFYRRWQKIDIGMPVEKVYDILPELAIFYAKQTLYLDNTILKIADYWLRFDFQGYLIDFGENNVPQSQDTIDLIF